MASAKPLVIEIHGDPTKFNRSMQSVDKNTGETAKKLKEFGKAAAAALAVVALNAVKNFVSGAVEAYSDLNESLNALEVTYGEHAEGIKKLGEESAQNLGISNAEFNNFAVSISAFVEQIAGDSGDVVGVVDELTTRVTDFASVMNLDVAEAQRKFQAGLAGESEPLRQFGIDVSGAKVEAYALANGIATAGEEMNEAQKVQARYGTIMEQTEKVQGDFARTADDYANAQRIANAEMENAKAAAGEALVPFQRLMTELELAGSKTLGILATQFGNLFGSISDVDSGIQQFEIHMGQSADTAEAALTIVKEYGGSFDELIPRLDLSREELERLRDADEDFLKSMGFTEEQVKDLSQAVGIELASSLTDAEQAARDSFAGIEEFKEGQEDADDATRGATDAIRDQIDELRAMSDPFFGAIKAAEDLEQAQLDYNQAVKDGDLKAQEEAIRDIAEANVDLKEKFAELKEQGIDPASEAGREAFKDMGLTKSQIDLIVGQFQQIANRMPVLDLSVRAPGIHYTARQNRYTPHRSRTYVYHEGVERVPGMRGQDVAATLQGGEEVISAAEAERRRKGNGSGVENHYSITVNAGVGDPLAIGRAVVEALQVYERSNGAIPINIRVD